MAYEQIAGPLGPARADIHMAVLAAAIANANRGKGTRKAKPEGFLPEWDRKPEPQTWQQQLAAVKQINAAHKGAVTRRIAA